MKHHYVPQFLLRAWTNASPENKIAVFRIDLEGIPSSWLAPKNTGYEDDLYALSKPVVAGMEKQAIEKHLLRHVDNLAAQIRRKLDEEGFKNLSPTERMDWVRFLMSLRIRQPDIVHQLVRESEDHLRETLAVQPEEYEAIAQDGDVPTLTECTEKIFPGVIENVGLSYFHELVNDAEIRNKILDMKWWLWDFSDVPHDLLLADHPCIFTPDIDDPDLIIALPISPKKAFMATRSDRSAAIMRRIDARTLASRLNESSVSQAKVRIYARNALPGRFIRNRLSKR